MKKNVAKIIGKGLWIIIKLIFVIAGSIAWYLVYGNALNLVRCKYADAEKIPVFTPMQLSNEIKKSMSVLDKRSTLGHKWIWSNDVEFDFG